MNLKLIESKNAPKAIGHYSHGTMFGNIIITSGQIPFKPNSNEMETDIKKATKIVLDNLLSVVEAGGGKLESIAKVDIFVKDLKDFAQINEVYSDFFGDHKPSRVLIQAADLPANALLEASMIAFAVVE